MNEVKVIEKEKILQKAKVLEFVKKYTMVGALIVVVAFFAWKTGGKILLPQNISNLISQNAYVFVLAVGMLLCILTGGNIDLSVGSVVCFTGAIGATLMAYGLSVFASIIIMLLIGTLIGAWQGLWIAYARVPAFIVTLAGMLTFRGLSNVVLNGMTVSVTDKTFINIFGGGSACYLPSIFSFSGLNGTCIAVGVISIIFFIFIQYSSHLRKKRMGYEVEKLSVLTLKTVVISLFIAIFTYKLSQYKGIPSVLIWTVGVVLLYSYVTSNTKIGRHFYAVGGNEKASKLSGIKTNRIFFIAYTNMGLLAALAGMITIARMTSAQPTYGNNYELDAIGACFIGGASAYGGIGTVPGVIIGALLMGVINLGMSIMGLDANLQKVVKGLVLLAAVVFDVLSKKSKNG